MRILVIDTALGLCTAGVFDVTDGRVAGRGLRSEPMVKGHQERLAGFARDAVSEAGGGFAALDRIAVTVGPGSFTGLRVGLAFAQGLGAALNRPVVGLSTLAGLAASAPAGDAVMAVVDARRGQVYAAVGRDGEARALSLEAAGAEASALGPRATLVGSGAPLLAEAVPDAVVLNPAGPSPEALARLAAVADPASAAPRPLYLRAPDAAVPTRLPGQPRAPR